MSKDRLFAVVLAAGRASRFGALKQLAEFDGAPLVRRAVCTAESVCGPNTIVVLGCEWRRVHGSCAPLRGFFVRNEAFDSGMASSIALGAATVAGAADAVLLTLCDQPFIDEAHLHSLIDAWDSSETRIACSAHQGVRGPPALYPALYFGELMALQGDHGAKSLLQKHAAQVIEVPSEKAAIDVDTLEDLAALSDRA